MTFLTFKFPHIGNYVLIALIFTLLTGMSHSDPAYLLGKVVDAEGDVIGASVKVTKGAELIRGAITDFNGEFRIQLDTGVYTVEVSYTGAQTQRIEGVVVKSGQLNQLPTIVLSYHILIEPEIIAYKVPLIEQGKGGCGLTTDQIKNLPFRTVHDVIATTPDSSSIEEGDIKVKGSRTNATNYYSKGIRVSNAPLEEATVPGKSKKSIGPRKNESKLTLHSQTQHLIQLVFPGHHR